jgi:hypothetical protein
MTANKFFNADIDTEKLKNRDNFPERNTEKFAPNAYRCLNSRAVRISTTAVEGSLKDHFAAMDKSRA